MVWAPQLFAFDLIGTLFDAKPSYVRAFNRAATNFNLVVDGQEDKLRQAIGNKRLSEIVSDIFPDFPANEFPGFQAECNRIRDREFEEHCVPFENAIDALIFLRDCGHELAIITATSTSGLETLVLKYNLGKGFIPKRNMLSRNLATQADASTTSLKNAQLWELKAKNPSHDISFIGDSMSDRNAAEDRYFDFWAFVPEKTVESEELKQMTPDDRVVQNFRQFISNMEVYEQYLRPQCRVA